MLLFLTRIIRILQEEVYLSNVRPQNDIQKMKIATENDIFFM